MSNNHHNLSKIFLNLVQLSQGGFFFVYLFLLPIAGLMAPPLSKLHITFSISGIDILMIGCTRHQGLTNGRHGKYSMNTLWLGHLVETMQSWENALKSRISYLCVRIPLQCSSTCRVWWSCGWMFPWHAVLTWNHIHCTLCLRAVPPAHEPDRHGMFKNLH